MTTDTPYLSITEENLGLVLRQAAQTWQQRATEFELKRGTKGRAAQLEAYLQGTLAVATATRLMTHQHAHNVAFMVAIGRAEEVIDRWASWLTDAEAAEACQGRANGLAAESRERQDAGR